MYDLKLNFCLLVMITPRRIAHVFGIQNCALDLIINKCKSICLVGRRQHTYEQGIKTINYPPRGVWVGPKDITKDPEDSSVHG